MNIEGGSWEDAVKTLSPSTAQHQSQPLATRCPTPQSSCSIHFLELIMGTGRVHAFSCYPGQLLTQPFISTLTELKVEMISMKRHGVLQRRDGDGNHINVQVPQPAAPHSQSPRHQTSFSCRQKFQFLTASQMAVADSHEPCKGVVGPACSLC